MLVFRRISFRIAGAFLSVSLFIETLSRDLESVGVGPADD